MVRFERDFLLKNYNTFGLSAKCKYFFEFTEEEDLPVFLSSFEEWKTMAYLFLGCGSNLLFVEDFNGIVFHPNIPGIKLVDEDEKHVWIEVGAGETWDDLVEYTVNKGYGGFENLSLIPGKVGASAVQNIGAYGVEIGDMIEHVKGFDLQSFEFCLIPVDKCDYSYRNSVFKKYLFQRFIVTSVIYRLDKYPAFKLDYGDLLKEITGEPDIRAIREAVIKIRQRKLPDTKRVGSAGSFFKNPVISGDKVRSIQISYPDVPIYPLENDSFKVAAGWLIDMCGWKGFRNGDAGVHENQALVIVNFGNATGKQLVKLANEIKESVLNRFGIELEPEVQIIL